MVDQAERARRFCSRQCGSSAASRRRYQAMPKEERVAKSYTPVPKHVVPCERCQAPIVKQGSEKRRFCPSCRPGKGHVSRAVFYGGEYEYINSRTVFARDGWVCQLCQRPVDEGLSWPHTESASLDHVVPLSRGGDHVRANVQLAHLGCNIAKGATLDAAD
jgi:5-methylcytosine-specific restriction endonuclease McrA